MKKFVQVALFTALLGVFACGGSNNNAANEEVLVEEEVLVIPVDTTSLEADTAVVATPVVE